MRNTNIKNKRKITGQGMTEYIIIVALIAIAAIAAVGYFGSAVQAQFANLGDKLMGETAANNAGTKPTPAIKDLKNYKD